MFSFLSERVLFKPKKCVTVTSITTLFKKVLEKMKTAKKAKSLDKERSLPNMRAACFRIKVGWG